jgi:hypothetical protein
MARFACVLFYRFYGFAFDVKPHHITYFATCVDADPALYNRAAERGLLCVCGETCLSSQMQIIKHLGATRV